MPRFPMPMPYQGPTPDWMTMFLKETAEVIEGAGMSLSTDVDEPSSMFNNPLAMFALGAEDEDEDEAKEWDDRPGIDKLIGFLTKAARRKPQPPKPCTTRLLACHRGETLIVLALTFTPTDPADAHIVSKTASWHLRLRVGAKDIEAWEGTITDGDVIEAALDRLEEICEQLQKEHEIELPPPEPGPGDYMPLGRLHMLGGGPVPMPVSKPEAGPG